MDAAVTPSAFDVEAVVHRLYAIIVGRVPDDPGLKHWKQIIQDRQDPALLVEALLASEEYRNQARHLIAGSATRRDRLYHYNANFDPDEVMRRHAVPDLRSRPDYLTNFLGVLINPDHFGPLLTACRGLVEDLPIPANWHADMAEWGAALRAVDLARTSFTMIELGCGWGCWMNNTGVAARNAGLDVHLIGIEGDEGHISFAHQAVAANGFLPSQVRIHHGVAAAGAGTALFPRQARSGVSWGLEPIFGATDLQRADALEQASHDILTMIPLSELVRDHQRIDLLHVDIQGGEADLIADAIEVLNAKVAYLLVGTHSRQIEGRLFSMLLESGWCLEIERPAILTVQSCSISIGIDGVQGWRNPRLIPLA